MGQEIRGRLFSSLLVVSGLFLVVAVWAASIQGEDLLNFVYSFVDRLFFGTAVIFSAYLVFVGLAVLVLLSTLSAWLQTQHPSVCWKRFDLLLFVPSFVPVYVYGISLQGITT